MLTYSSRRFPRGIQIAATALILLLPAADGLRAQPVSDNLRLGSTVRVVTPDPDAPVIEGSVRTIDAARLTLASREYGLRDLPWAEVDSLYVRHYTSKAGRGAGYGLLAGATISGLVMFATYEECDEEIPLACITYPSREFVTLAGAITGGLLGAAAGFFCRGIQIIYPVGTRRPGCRNQTGHYPPATRPSIHRPGVPPYHPAGPMNTTTHKLWHQSLPPELRSRIRELHTLDRRYNWIAAYFVTNWIVAAWLVLSVEHPAVRILGTIWIGIVIHGLAPKELASNTRTSNIRTSNTRTSNGHAPQSPSAARPGAQDSL